MKRFITLLLVVAATLGAQAQLLWKVSGNGLDKPSYLFGTYHLAALSIKDSIAALPQVQQDVQQVYGELVMADMMKPETLMQMQQQMMLPADTTLRSLFSPKEFEVVTRAVTEYLKVDIALLDRMKPAAIFQQLTVLFYLKHTPGYNPQEQLDASFQQDATKAGKKVGGLETVRQAKELIAAYAAQDLDKMLQLMEEKEGTSCDPTPEEMAQLLYDRNHAWAKQMPALMQTAPTLFVVGAGHLPGERGVLSLLKEKGYTVEPMK